MDRKVFLVDTENVGKYDFLDEYDLNENDEVVLFVSQSSKKISLVESLKIRNCKADVKIENVIIGTKNALDFQLVVYMTREIERNGSSIYIVSEDKGFKAAIDYIKSFQDAEIELIFSGNNISESFQEEVYKIEDELRSIMSSVITKEEDLNRFFSEINNAPKNMRLSYVHNELISNLGGEDGQRLYKSVRSKIKRLCNAEDRISC